jgi:glycosyltransferase involved in cell wall biosynthesis
VAQLNHFEYQGRIQDFKLGGAYLKKLRRAEGGAKIFGVFRVKKHDFTKKNHIFFNYGGRRDFVIFHTKYPKNFGKYMIFLRKIVIFHTKYPKNFGVFRMKNHDFTQKIHIFSNFREARAGCAPLDPSLNMLIGAH